MTAPSSPSDRLSSQLRHLVQHTHSDLPAALHTPGLTRALDSARAVLERQAATNDPRPSAADQALREACQPFLQAIHQDQGVETDRLTAQDLRRLRDTASAAHPRTPLRLAVQPILDRISERTTGLHAALDRVDEAHWTRLRRVDASARALTPIPEGDLAQTDRAFTEAVGPFAGAVFNDNGDVTLTVSHLNPAHWVALQEAYAGISVDHPLRARALPFLDCLTIRDGQPVIDDTSLDFGDWLRLRNGWLACLR